MFLTIDETVFDETTSFFFLVNGMMFTFPSLTSMFTCILSNLFRVVPSLPLMVSIRPLTEPVTPSRSSTEWTFSDSVDIAKESPSGVLLLRLGVREHALWRRDDQHPDPDGRQ